MIRSATRFLIVVVVTSVGLTSTIARAADTDGQARVVERARLALDMFIHRIRHYMGAYFFLLGRVDALVFTAGIGERSSIIRERVCAGTAWLGIDLDQAANDAGGPKISTDRSKVSVWVIPTDEELMIARHTLAALGRG